MLARRDPLRVVVPFFSVLPTSMVRTATIFFFTNGRLGCNNSFVKMPYSGFEHISTEKKRPSTGERCI